MRLWGDEPGSPFLGTLALLSAERELTHKMWALLLLAAMPCLHAQFTSGSDPGSVLLEYNTFPAGVVTNVSTTTRVVRCDTQPFVFVLTDGARLVVFDRSSTGLVARPAVNLTQQLVPLLRPDQPLSDVRLLGGVCFSTMLLLYTRLVLDSNPNGRRETSHP